MNKILVLDFDGTLCYNAWPDISCAKQRLMHKLVLAYARRKQTKGWIITLDTMREDRPHKDMDYLFDAITWCYKHRLPINYANDNQPSMTKKFGYSRKIYGNIRIDDHNIGLIGWLLRRASR